MTGACILVVEDEIIIAKDIESSLSSMGYDVAGIASTRAEVLDNLDNEGVDLVLMDISLSGNEDGIDIAREIKNRYCLPVIFLSAHSDHATLERAKDAEPYGFLTKPFDDGDLKSIIETALHKHRANRRLFDNQKTLSLILEHAEDGICYVTHDGYIKECNQAFAAMVGKDRKELLNRRFWDLGIFTEKVLERNMDIFKGLLSGKTIQPFERKWFDDQGELHMSEITLEKVDDPRYGKSVLVMAKDITERKIRENRIKRELERISTILRNMPIGIVFIDPNNRTIVDVNPYAEKLIGATRSQIINRGCQEFVCTNLAGSCPFIDKTRRRVDNRETALINVNGEKIPILKSVMPITLDRSEFLLECFFDIRESKAMQKQIEFEREMFNSLAGCALDAIFMLNGKNQVIFWNSTAEGMFGYSGSEVLGKELDRVIPSIVVGKVRTAPESGNAGNGCICAPDRGVRNTVARRKNGETFPIGYTISQFTIDREHFTVGIARDRTGEMLREKEREKLLKELEERNKDLDQYTYMVSHDLKAPLVTIQGFTELLKRKYGEGLDDNARRYLDTIERSAKEMSSLVTDLLQLSRVSTSEEILVDVNVKEALKDTLDSFSSEIREKNAVVKLRKDLPVVKYNPTHFKQLLSNLIGNALKYARDDEPPVIEIDCRESGDELLFSVKDNGVGIERKYWREIFKPFERLSNDDRGNGIGLSIVKKIVKRYGGRVWLKSMLGKGTTFYFTVPRRVT